LLSIAFPSLVALAVKFSRLARASLARAIEKQTIKDFTGNSTSLISVQQSLKRHG
jgi:hypothetical protein